MKRLINPINTLLAIALVMFSSLLFGQVPEGMNYQAVVRDAHDDLLRDQIVTLEVDILNGNGEVVYEETHLNIATNSNGLLTVQIGDGEPLEDSPLAKLNEIDWSLGTYSVKTRVLLVGTPIAETDATTFKSVPYAFHASTTDSIIGGIEEKDGSVLNEIQELRVSADGDTLYLTKSNYVVIPGISEATVSSNLVENQFSSQALVGNPMGNDPLRNVSVYLPPGYYQDREFPVVYLLPGTPFDHRGYIDSATWYAFGMDNVFAPPDFPKDGFKKWMDDLMNSGEIQEMIVVMPDASCMYGSSWYTNSSLNGAYETYIADDLVRFIDQNYKTIKSRDARAIMGHCVGGYGAMKIGLKHPDIFGAVAANTPMLSLSKFGQLLPMIVAENPDGMSGPSPEKFFTSVLYAMSAAFSPNLNNPPFFVDLPFEWPNTTMLDSVSQKWQSASIFGMLDEYADNIETLNGFYYDWGDNDEFTFLADDPLSFNMSLAMQHNIDDFDFERHSGSHYSNLYERMAVALMYISGYFDSYH